MPTRTSSRRVTALSVLALAGGLAACSADSLTNGNGATVPAAALSTASDQVSSITSDSLVVRLFGPVLSNASLAAAPTRSPDAGAMFTRLATDGARALRLGSGPAATLGVLPTPRRSFIGTSQGMTIPADMWGKTYVHDTSDAYVVDSTATGAPPNGFRLMLYPWNATAPTGQQWGTTPIGYADVMDEGTASEQKIVVDMYAVGGATPVVAFKVASGAVNGAEADTLAGTVNAAGGKTLSYEFDGITTGSGTAAERTVTKVHVTAPGSKFAVDGQFVDGLQASDVQTLTTTVGSDAVGLSVGTVLQNGAYTESDTTKITVNGNLAGYMITQVGTSPRLVKPDGSEMSADEKLALLKLAQTLDRVFVIVGVTSFFALWAIALGLMI